MRREVCRVGSDPRNSQMRDWIDSIRATCWAFRDIREASLAELRQQRQQKRIRAMSDEELMLCARQWGGHVVRPELRRRGLPFPGERTGA
jgi:hypothetical protein